MNPKLVRVLRSMWPRQVGNQCLAALAFGALMGWLALGHIAWLEAVAQIFLQASQIVVMPFLICELIVGFGKLPARSLKLMALRAAVGLLFLWLLGASVIVSLPLFLPKLITSEFYHAGLFEEVQPSDLIEAYLPGNIFGALANGTYRAVVLYSSLLGVLLQGIDVTPFIGPVLMRVGGRGHAASPG